MQITKIIEAAQVARGLLPQTFICGCCGSLLDRDDHMRGHFKQDHEDAVTEQYGPMVCFGCADDFEADQSCTDCGHEACTCDDTYEARISEQLLEGNA